MKKLKLTDLNRLSKKDFNGTIKIIPTYLLEVLETIELPIKNRKIAIRSVCDFLSCLSIKQSETQSSLIQITRDTFIKYFNRNTYNNFKEILKNNEVITQVQYESGIGYSQEDGLPKQYRIHTKYLQETDFTILIFDNNKSKIETRIKTDVNINFLNTILNEELDYVKVLKDEYEYHIKKNTSLTSLYLRVSRALGLNVTRYIQKGTKVNRIYHSFSNLSKITRKCFKTKFNNIDLKNSQPMFLAFYLKSNKIPFEKEYQNVCEDGLFYELFYDLYPELNKEIDKKEVRKKVKQSIYESILFAFNKTRRVNKRFQELFPLTWLALYNVSQSGITLASILQNLEAEIFNNLELKYSKKYFTMFDAIYFNNPKDYSNIVNQIKSKGKEFGIEFSISYND